MLLVKEIKYFKKQKGIKKISHLADEYFINDEYLYVVKSKEKKEKKKSMLQRVSSKEVFIFIKGLPEMNRVALLEKPDMFCHTSKLRKL